MQEPGGAALELSLIKLKEMRGAILLHSQRQYWEEQAALGGTMDLCEWGLDLHCFN